MIETIALSEMTTDALKRLLARLPYMTGFRTQHPMQWQEFKNEIEAELKKRGNE